MPVAVWIYLIDAPKDTGNRGDSSEDLAGALALSGRRPVKRAWRESL